MPQAVKKQRNNALLAVQEEVSADEHAAFIGRTVEVLVEGPSKVGRKQPEGAIRQLVGRTRTDHIAVFDADESLTGTMANIHIDSATALTLFGRVVPG